MLRLLLLAAVLCVLPGQAPAAQPTLTLRFNEGALEAWHLSLRWQGGKALAPADRPRAGYSERRLALAAAEEEGDLLRFQGDSGLVLSRKARQLALSSIAVSLRTKGRFVWLSEPGGPALLRASMPHRYPVEAGGDWRNLDLHATAALAERLGQPRLEGALLGGLDLRWSRQPSPLFGGLGAPTAKGGRRCRQTAVFHSEQTPTDVQMIDIGRPFQMRCEGCTSGSSNGRLVIAPSADLGNVGAADVPWIVKFGGDGPPYGADQHPYLVWALYREDGAGRLDQIAVSGLKHAFISQNDSCDCQADFYLFRGCTDLYSAFTNDSADDLGPRSEVIPARGLWGRCGSLYDRDCNNSFDQGAAVADGFAERAVVTEAELAAARAAGDRLYIEAWYVVRDDVDIDNSVGHRMIGAEKVDAGWVFDTLEPMRNGFVVDRWAARGGGARYRAAERASLVDGHLQVGVRIEALGDGRFRYHYVLFNLDHARVVTAGAPPSLRILEHRGLAAFELPIAAGLAVEQVEFRDSDTETGNDWALDVEAGRLRWTAPAGADLGWGRQLRFSFVTAAGPERGMLRVGLDPAAPAEQAGLPLWAPLAPGHLFADGLED
ncbi:hypothetical protein [Pseudomarimonas salicorniae]|uniref:Uncharacterized protein n=1 Tax=Pseudomarimonas salicorniae TaxID=2933270 RepID=A0ABT0GKH6_9GAMM|nr:hypothetical protein [Lysobacter sp. CAU 1642]MCK7595039.1 hypothetical protein [Lysobacter sp. CAU 1642]